MKTDIFHDLDSIPWHRLRGCYGDGRNIPKYLRELISEDQSTHEQALEEIFSAVWHQGTIYDLTSYVVPYLIRLLQVDIELEKSELLLLLTCIAEGVGYHGVHTISKEQRQIWESIFAEQGTTIEAELATEQARVHATRQAVLQGVSVYIESFQQATAQTFKYTCELFGALPQVSEQTLPLLKNRYGIAGEQRPIMMAIQRLAHSDEDTEWLLAVFREPATEPEIKYLSIEPLVRLLGGNVPSEVLDYLVGLVATYVHPDRLYSEAGISGYSVAQTVQICARFLPTPNNYQLCERALCAAISPGECVVFSVCMLDCYLFGEPLGRSYAIGSDSVIYYFGGNIEHTVQPPPTPELCRLLALLINHDPVWQTESDFLTAYGLPQEREKLAQLLLPSQS